MVRPAVELADILRARGDCFREQNRSWLGYQQLNVLRAITVCRTAALGGPPGRLLRLRPSSHFL